MRINYHKFNREDSDEARSENIRLLSDGVQGISCTNVGLFGGSMVSEKVRVAIEERMNVDEKLGTVEEYQNGKYNVYVRVYTSKFDYYLDGFFRVETK